MIKVTATKQTLQIFWVPLQVSFRDRGRGEFHSQQKKNKHKEEREM